MSVLSFKKIKLFKTKEVPTKRIPNNKTPLKNDEEPNFWQKLIKSPFLYLFVFVIALTYLASYVPSKSLPQLQVGDIASVDIEAPEELTLVDDVATEKFRREAIDSVLPIYVLDEKIMTYTEDNIRQFFISGRDLLEQDQTDELQDNFIISTIERFGLDLTNNLKALMDANFSTDMEESLISLLRKVSSRGIILTKTLFIRGEEERGFTLVEGPNREKTVSPSDILDKGESEEQLVEEIGNLNLPPEEKSLLVILARFFVSSNVTYDGVETEARKVEASNSVGSVFYTIKKGRIIIRKGDEVSADTARQIELINQNLQAQSGWLIISAGTLLLFGLLFITIWYYLKSLVNFSMAFKYFLMTGLLLIASFLIYKLSLFLAETFSLNSNFFLLKYIDTYNFALPFQFGILIFAFLASIPVALIFTILNSILIGYLFQTSFPIMIFCLIGGFAAIYGIKFYGKNSRTSIFRAGLFVVAPVNTLLIIIFNLLRDQMGSLDFFASEIVMGLVGGLLSATLSFLFLPVFENLFGIITQSKLLEVANSDLPIFRQMAMEAPGSYHHSLIVAALAENAAEEIKLDSMLVKAAALYHDVGKVKRPEYFYENQARNPDMHKDLKPSMSALVIFNHVKEGVELARSLKLPKRIRDVIEQHHGTSIMRYFFEKAKVEYDPEMQKIGEESYRYAGPIPQSKEAGLVMLADAIEAASRSLKNPTQTNLKRVINDLINTLIQDGQLDDCGLSLKEMKAIANSFLSTLNTIYHQRAEYPGFDFEKKRIKNNSSPKASNDRNSKPAK